MVRLLERKRGKAVNLRMIPVFVESEEKWEMVGEVLLYFAVTKEMS